MIKKPAERLVELLESHGILDHCCPICPNAHGLWANHLGGPRHYQNLYHFPEEDLRGPRFQPWDLPGRVGYAGRWGWVGTGLNHIQHVTYAYDATYCIHAACMLYGILYCIMYISLIIIVSQHIKIHTFHHIYCYFCLFSVALWQEIVLELHMLQ